MVLVKPSSKSTAMGGIVCVVTFQVIFLFCGRCIGAVDLFPFGSDGFNMGQVDDHRMEVNTPSTVLVAGHEISSVLLSANGFIDFVGRTFLYGRFDDGVVSLIGFGTDFTTTNDKGNIWIDIINNAQDVMTLESEIHLVDPDFNASHAVVVTWDNVGVYSSFGIRLSFQMILVWDGERRKTFGILNYKTLGLSAEPEAGFNSGNASTSFRLGEGLDHIEIQDFLLNQSNVGVPGKFVMRIDGGDPCIGFFYPQMSVDGGPWITDKATSVSIERKQSVELKCQSDPDDWDGSKNNLDIRCDNGRVGSFVTETKLATLTMDMQNPEEWVGVTCRCQTVPPSCTSSVTFDTLLDAPTMKNFSIQSQTTEVVTLDSDSDVTRVVFECVAHGFPTPWIAIMGLHTGLVIANQSAPDDTLRVDVDLTCSNLDQYVCVAENSYGTSNRSAKILLRIPCMESVEDVETVRVSDDSIVNVVFKVKAVPKPTSFSLSKVRGGRTHYMDELLYDPSYYVVQYTETDDVLGLGTVQLKLIDFDLVDMNVYRFRMSNGKAEPLEISFNSTSGTLAQVYTPQDSSQTNLIVVAVVVGVLVCVCAVFPIAYWYYAVTQGIRPLAAIPQKTRRKMTTDHRRPSFVYTLQGQTHMNVRM